MGRPHTTFIAALVLLTAALTPVLVGAGDGSEPIVLVHGWTGSGDSWREMIPKLEAQGLTVIDFDPNTAGTQALSYGPTGDGQHLPYLAGKVVDHRIDQALVDNGFSTSTEIDIVAHSMGGLVARFLVEQPGADVDHWSDDSGWYGDGTPDVANNWADRVDQLIMLGTPNHGTWEAWVPANIGGFGQWNPSGGDMEPGSVFLDRMGYAEPSGESYHGVGGDPAYFNFLQYDHDGDGTSHGFDGVVPAESPYVTGATMDYTDDNHFGLRTSDTAIDLTLQLLGLTSGVDGIGDANLAGDLVLRLEHLQVAQDHDGGSSDEIVVDAYVDPDGQVGDGGYEYVGTFEDQVDGPFTRDYGDGGPTFDRIALPGGSSVVDVKLVVKEDDTSWGGGYEAVSTHYLTNLMLSEDIDGQDYYEGTATDAKGGTNTVRASLNGISADVEHTRYVRLGLSSSYIKDDHDWGEGEVTHYINGGRLGYTTSATRGEVGGDHYGRDSGEWIDVGTHATDGGQVQPEVVWSGRMLYNATLRFDVTYWEDDGGWSGADGGNQYYLEDALSTIPEGRTNYVGDTLPDYDAYVFVEKEGPETAGTAIDEPLRPMTPVLDPSSLIPDGPDDPPSGPLHPGQ